MTEFDAIDSEQLLAVYKAALSVANEFELEPVLQTLADQSRAMVNARFAALGVTNDDLKIRLFITSGIDESTRKAIGPYPEGRGLLGAIIHDRAPLRLERMSDDPRSAGFPPNHPSMTSLLGVPVTLNGRVLGNLYLCDREDGQPFSEEDQRVVEALAVYAAAAIDRAEMVRDLANARAESERRWDFVQTLLEQLPVGVYVPGPNDDEIRFINSEARRLFGIDPSSDGDLSRMVLHTDSGERVSNRDLPSERAARGESVRGATLWAGEPTGDRHPVLVSAIPLSPAQPEGPDSVVVMQDMTRIREAEQLKSEFLSLVSHELNTPITTIIGAAHLLKSDAGSLSDVDRHELLDDLVGESDRLAKMLSNLITVTAVYAGTIAAQTEPVLIEHVVKRAIEAARRRARERMFFIELPRDLPPVEADPGLLDHVLSNILDNSIKYGSSDGQVRVRAEVIGSSVIISIDDDGPGVDPAKVSHLFQRFFRANRDSSSHGLGLGLYLCRFLMEAQGGRIWATSEGPGKGMTISLELAIARGWSDEDTETDEK